MVLNVISRTIIGKIRVNCMHYSSRNCIAVCIGCQICNRFNLYCGDNECNENPGFPAFTVSCMFSLGILLHYFEYQYIKNSKIFLCTFPCTMYYSFCIRDRQIDSLNANYMPPLH